MEATPLRDITNLTPGAPAPPEAAEVETGGRNMEIDVLANAENVLAAGEMLTPPPLAARTTPAPSRRRGATWRPASRR